jgi:acetoin utilization protein AcuB
MRRRTMIVANWMTKNPKTIDANATLLEARQAMDEGRFRCLPVVSKGSLVGVLSERDLRAHEAYLAQTRVNAAMTPDPITIPARAHLEEAARILLERKIGSLPVMEGTELVGIITVTDLLKAFLEFTGQAETGTTQIGLVLTESSQNLASVERIVTESGGRLLSFGTLNSPPDQDRVYYIRVLGDDSTSIASRLKAEGYRIVDG